MRRIFLPLFLSLAFGLSSPASASESLPQWTNAFGMSFRLIPAGKTVMGREGWAGVSPRREVTISREFGMGTTEVTQGQWKAVMGGKNPSEPFLGNDLPVNRVSWNDAQAFIKKLNELQIADMQQDLADSYYDMAKYKWDRFYEKFVPLEKKLLKEVLNEPLKEMDCADDMQRASDWVGRAYGAMQDWTARKAKQMRVCMNALDRRRPRNAQALALADTANYNYVDDRWFCDYSNDKRWNRRSSVLNLGRNLGSEALKYGDVARGLLNTISGQVEQAAQGLVSALGYYGARLDTYYPSSYLGQSQGNLAN
ncbi:MAG: SUMF1/EgtB/PvdO family nonheme iron enzyme, partial [Mailhella sp.]|nr:SUMF1/EgtB/PvdO family nonheme iron enzyme [Mailhella sp.]